MFSIAAQLINSDEYFPFEEEKELTIQTAYSTTNEKDTNYLVYSEDSCGVVEQFFALDDEEELENTGEILLKYLCSSSKFDATNAVTQIVKTFEIKTHEDQVCGLALEVLSHCHRSDLEVEITDVIRRLLVSTNEDLSFLAISILPNLLPRVRGAFQHMVIHLASDTNVPEDIRDAANAEITGFRRKHLIR